MVDYDFNVAASGARDHQEPREVDAAFDTCSSAGKDSDQEPMQFLTVSRRKTESFSESEFAAQVNSEIERARELYSQGAIRQIWHRADVAGACILVEADSEEHAREIVGTLPMMRAGMLEMTVIPLKPYAGFCPR